MKLRNTDGLLTTAIETLEPLCDIDNYDRYCADFTFRLFGKTFYTNIDGTRNRYWFPCPEINDEDDVCYRFEELPKLQQEMILAIISDYVYLRSDYERGEYDEDDYEEEDYPYFDGYCSNGYCREKPFTFKEFLDFKQTI